MRTIRSGVIVAGLGVAVLLGGCTSASTAAPSPSSTAGSSSTSTSVGTVKTTTSAPTSTIKPLPAATVQHTLPTKIKDTPALRTTILLTGCEKAAGGWKATGTAKNTGSGPATYDVVVFFTDKYSRVVDSATTKFTVAGGRSATWAAAQKFTPPDGVKCVLRGVSKA